MSSANEDLQPQLSAKRRIIALNKKDLANPNVLNVRFYMSLPLCLVGKRVFFWNFFGLVVCRNGLIILNRRSKTVLLLMRIAEALSRRLDMIIYVNQCCCLRFVFLNVTFFVCIAS